MTHPDLTAQLDAYLDDELAAVDAREFEAHLAQCADCARLRDDRLALRAAIKARLPALHASDALRARVRAAMHDTSPARTPNRFGSRVFLRPLAFAASLAVIAFGSWQLAIQQAGGDAIVHDVLASHVRSLMPGHLTDVLSSDQHTVKPWFNGRLDFSPPVYDFAGRGYPLLGGRLDYVDGRAVAALVYGRRQHVINVFLWPEEKGQGASLGTRTRQGYHLLHWTGAGYSYWVVSDLGPEELAEFAGLLAQAEVAAGAPK